MHALEADVRDVVVAPVPRSYDTSQSAPNGRETRSRGTLGQGFLLIPF